jgi:LuxR family maltose regulon positive regulatory protein
MVVVDGEEFRRLPGAIAVYRAAQTLAVGDVAGTIRHARRALDLVSADDQLGRGSASGLMGLAYWTTGDLDQAHRSYSECMASLERVGFIADTLGCAIALADIRIAQGRPGDAMRTYERASQRASEAGPPVLRGTADMHVGMSELYLERNDLAIALQHLRTSTELGEHAGLPQNAYRGRVALARIRTAEGDLDGALDLLVAAEREYLSDYFPEIRPIAALKARVWIAQGKLGEAMRWARERGLSAEDDLAYLREFEHITLARIMLAHRDQGDRAMQQAPELLERLLRSAQDGGRTASVIEILILQALGLRAGGDAHAALAPLERALALAEPEGYVRAFVGEGPEMASLLEAAAKRGPATAYARAVLEAFGRDKPRAAGRQPLAEPLSERELDVLRLLASDLDGPDIARELVVSLNTVRSHTKSIYAKLGVNSRREAVRRAAELDLLTRTDRDR